jgi:hypothetical protein
MLRYVSYLSSGCLHETLVGLVLCLSHDWLISLGVRISILAAQSLRLPLNNAADFSGGLLKDLVHLDREDMSGSQELEGKVTGFLVG